MHITPYLVMECKIIKKRSEASVAKAWVCCVLCDGDELFIISGMFVGERRHRHMDID